MKIRKLQGTVLNAEKTGDTITDEDGDKWEKCVFTVELTNFSKRSLEEIIPETLKGKRVKIVRYCCFDWHYKLGIKKTLTIDETGAILADKSTETVYW
jgi:hypothetical protein